MTRSNRFAPFVLAASILAVAQSTPGAAEPAALPANKWTLLHQEDGAGGKKFARLIFAEDAGRLYLWGIGGRQPDRTRFERYELESFSPDELRWTPAFPASKQDKWSAADYPPFRIYGQGGTDGPRMSYTSGFGIINRVTWWDFDGTKRPSPVNIFNQCCYDSKRKRIVFFAGGKTFALDPATNEWSDLEPQESPAACEPLTWASLCYDPVNDAILLFGGGLATNAEGGVQTWVYDCEANRWQRPKLELEPPLRCTSPIVAVPEAKALVMFGGYDQASALNDTWVYDCTKRVWAERKPAPSPPPMFAPAVAAIPGTDKLLAIEYDALAAKENESRTRAARQTWIYDVSDNAWQPVGEDLVLPRAEWLTATSSGKDGLVYLVAFGSDRQTYALRYDGASAAPVDGRSGHPPGARAWKYREQRDSLENAPPADPEAQRKLLAGLPANTFVDAKPPGTLISKTWSTAVFDPHTSQVIYHGGGHSGYTGNDVARYDVATNRWSLDQPPRFPPYLEGTNAAVFGWSYGRIPWSQHTYRWYAYDPVSKLVVYCARMTLHPGLEVQLPADRFQYDPREHGDWTWLYDPAKKVWHGPIMRRPFGNEWHLALVGTPRGVFALVNGVLWRARVDAEKADVTWERVDGDGPQAKRGYSYEFQPLVYDSKRDRLLHLMGTKDKVEVHAGPLDGGGKWEKLAESDRAAIAREVVYVPKQDALLWLATEGLFAMDLAANRIGKLDVELPKGAYGTEHAFVHDPGHDVCIALVPSKFSGAMQTFLFRYERGGK